MLWPFAFFFFLLFFFFLSYFLFFCFLEFELKSVGCRDMGATTSRVEQGEQGEQGEPGTLAAQPTAAATLLVVAPMSRHPTLFNSNSKKQKNRK